MPIGSRLAAAVVTVLLFGAPAGAIDVKPQEINILAGAGRSLTNWHGASRFTSLQLEMLSRSAFLDRHLANSELVTSLTYNKVRQPRSWFGYRDGDPDDSVRAESFVVAARKNWRTSSAVGLFAELGTGPMWSNRRVPAATSRLNLDSQLAFGMNIHAAGTPLYVIYRFSHISNGGISKRNPGLQVNSFAIGTRAFQFRH